MATEIEEKNILSLKMLLMNIIDFWNEKLSLAS